MEKKLVVLDLDGTLLNSEHLIDIETKDYIKALEKKGIEFVIATGRTYTAAKRYHRELGLKTPLISCNGGFIYDPVHKKVVDGHVMKQDILEKIFKFFIENNTFFQFYSADTIYSTEVKYLLESWTNQNNDLDDEDIINIEIIEDPLRVLNIPNISIFKMLAIEEDENVYNQLIKVLETIEDIEIVSSFKGAIDIMNKGITKGMALKFVANYLNIPIENTIAMGDNNNDASMLEAAGLGIAMKNATAHAKDHSDVITDDNNDQGVLKALKKYL